MNYDRPFKMFHVNEYMGGYAIKIIQPYINDIFLMELQQILDDLEKDESVNIIYFFGNGNVFCKGLDFSYIVGHNTDRVKDQLTYGYSRLLYRIKTYPKFVVAYIDGKVMAGGVGIACVCDYLMIGKNTAFQLTEILWGLLPAMIAPYIINRIGIHRFHVMTALMKNVDSKTAVLWNLADEETEKIDDSARKLFLRIRNVPVSAIKREKEFINKIQNDYSMNSEELSKVTCDLLKNKGIFDNIGNYVQFGKLPLER